MIPNGVVISIQKCTTKYKVYRVINRPSRRNDESLVSDPFVPLDASNFVAVLFELFFVSRGRDWEETLTRI